MAKTANLYARIEPDVKEQAETILNALGIPASNAITMFYKQIILKNGLPFEVKLPDHPLNVSKKSEMCSARISKRLSIPFSIRKSINFTLNICTVSRVRLE